MVVSVIKENSADNKKRIQSIRIISVSLGGATLKNATLGDIPLFSVSGQMKMPQR